MFKSVKRVLCVAVVVVSAAAMISCDLLGDDDNDDKSSNGGGGGGDITTPYLGQSFTLPSGTIVDWGWDFDGSAEVSVILDDSPETTFGPVAVGSDGRFPGMQITAPQGTLDLWTEFTNEYELTISDPAARGASFYELVVWQDGVVIGEVWRESADGRTVVEWWYVDRDVRISGEMTISDDEEDDEEDLEIVLDVDLDLRSGWNQLIIRIDSSFESGTLRVGTEPSGVRWEYW